jgi:hypothetical protein
LHLDPKILYLFSETNSKSPHRFENQERKVHLTVLLISFSGKASLPVATYCCIRFRQKYLLSPVGHTAQSPTALVANLSHRLFFDSLLLIMEMSLIHTRYVCSRTAGQKSPFSIRSNRIRETFSPTCISQRFVHPRLILGRQPPSDRHLSGRNKLIVGNSRNRIRGDKIQAPFPIPAAYLTVAIRLCRSRLNGQ